MTFTPSFGRAHAISRAAIALVVVVVLAACTRPTQQTLSPLLTVVERAGAAVEAASAKTTAKCSRSGPQRLVPRGVMASSGPIALATWGKRAVALVADADEDALHVVGTADMRRLASLPLPASPAHLLVTRDGRVMVSLRYANRVMLLQPAEHPADGFTTLCSRATVREPIALAERLLQRQLLVTSGFAAELVVFAAESLDVAKRVPLPREPRAIILSEDQNTAWISHMLGGVLSRVNLNDSSHQAIVTHRGEAQNGEPSRSVQGFALAAYRDGRKNTRLLMPQAHSAAPDPERDAAHRYYGTTPRTFQAWVASVDASSGKMLGVNVENGASWKHLCMLPRAAIVKGKRLWVACLDKGTVVEIDARFINPMDAVYRQYRVAAGPNGLAMSETGTLYVWSLFGHKLTRIQTPSLDERAIADVPQPEASALTLPRRIATRWPAGRLLGRTLFHARDDERISNSGASCAGCHPDGRDDGLAWAEGNATLFLAGRLTNTAPFGWHGQQATLHERVKSTCERLSGSGFSGIANKAAFAQLIDYLRDLTPPPPPLPHDQREAASIVRGKQLFDEELSCAACHPGGSANGSKLRVDGTLFDTPSLAFVGQSAPFFHDNRYASLEELLRDPKEPMDQTLKLTEGQRADVAAYLRSLPYGVVSETPAVGEDDHARSETAEIWQETDPAQTVAQLLAQPGPYLQKRPQRIALNQIPTFERPYSEAKLFDGKPVWQSLRNIEGSLLGTTDDGVARIQLATGVRPNGQVLPRYVAVGGREPQLEVSACKAVGGPQWREQDHDVYNVKCLGKAHRYKVVQFGRYGFAARTQFDGHDMLLAIGPDSFAKTGAGARYDIGTIGRGWTDLHGFPLERGSHSSHARYSSGDGWWSSANLPTDLDMAIINVSWMANAPEPEILVATLTRQSLLRKSPQR